MVRSSASAYVPPAIAYAFVDAQYLRKEFRNARLRDNIDPWKIVAKVHQRLGRRVVQAVRLFFYDAIDEDDSAEEAHQEEAQQRDYFRRVEALDDTMVIVGQVRRGAASKSREQKGVDVQLAIDALLMASRGDIEAVILVTGDADFTPLAEAIRRLGPHVIVAAYPKSLASSLKAAADRFSDISPVDQSILLD